VLHDRRRVDSLGVVVEQEDAVHVRRHRQPSPPGVSARSRRRYLQRR
jgi:hypothetical protein